MQLSDFKQLSVPQNPGVYLFLSATSEILYIGKATNLKQRVRSYFDDDVIKTRGRHIVDMVALSSLVKVIETDTVLDALILEASLIKKYLPKYNTREKDNKSFAYIAISNEEFPRVTILRERTIALLEAKETQYKYVFGPFHGVQVCEQLLRVLRKIIPYRDLCRPLQHKPCFHKQIGLCPGVCDGSISKRAYAEKIKALALFLSGEKNMLLRNIEMKMHRAAHNMNFEEAAAQKHFLFALMHINDVSLVSDDTKKASFESAGRRDIAFRIEAFDIAHLFGTHTVGVMVVVEDGKKAPSQYRKFKIREKPGKVDDLFRLEEVLVRRFSHPEWRRPQLIVIDGGVVHVKRVKEILSRLQMDIPVVSVVKDSKHKAKGIIGNRDMAVSYKPSIILANYESHRFAIQYHRTLRDRIHREK